MDRSSLSSMGMVTVDIKSLAVVFFFRSFYHITRVPSDSTRVVLLLRVSSNTFQRCYELIKCLTSSQTEEAFEESEQPNWSLAVECFNEFKLQSLPTIFPDVNFATYYLPTIFYA